MSTTAHPHEEILKEIREEFTEILGQTTQGVYFYLDDPHWTCNERLASMLGFASAAELLKAAGASSLLDALVAPDSRDEVVSTYMNTVQNKVAASRSITWKTKSSGTLKTNVIFVPISYHGNLLTLHFVTPV